MTEKLYYKDAYIKEFSARVLSCEACQGGFLTVLDRTAMFPEGGGQCSDSGYIGSVRVLDVKETRGVIYHKTEEGLTVGEEYLCRVDFEERFERMQMHTAEHILSGILSSQTGAANIGFHLTRDGVTFDTDRKIEKEEIKRAEELANLVIYENREVRTYFPSADELQSLTYRSKLDLTDGVRIVEIDGVDRCACCAPHVSRCGEIGIIKIISHESHRGGTRMFMKAGRCAYRYLSELSDIAARLCAMLSSPVHELAESCERIMSINSELEYKISKKNDEISRIFSEKIEKDTPVSVCLLPFDSMDALMGFVNIAADKCDVLVALFGSEGDYRYVIKTKKEDVAGIVKSANVALCGKGGGRGDTAQGRFLCSLSDIEKYFLG